MLLLFFGLVLLCAVFFAIGFSLGRKTAAIPTASAANAGGTVPATVVRPSAAKNTQPVQPAEDFSFYKAVEQKSSDATLAPQDSQAQPEAPSGAAAAKTDNAPPATSPAGTGYFVQVAAVSRKEDADALVEALKKKQYPAFTTSTPAADKFYHVQVGPYAELKDAEAMRVRLISDGYNPILKK